MSERIVPSFTVDGKEYKIIFTRTLQAEYQRMTNEKKKDKEYQKRVVEYARLQSEFEEINNKYQIAKRAALDDPTNKELREKYLALKDYYMDAYNAFKNYNLENDGADDAQEFTLYLIGQLVLKALETQYNMSRKEAESVWDKYYAEHGETGTIEWLAYCGEVFFTGVEDDPKENFIKVMRERNKKK